MEIKSYGGVKVITCENIRLYVNENIDKKRTSDMVSNYLKESCMWAPPKLARETYGLNKSFNYSRGLNLFTTDSVVKLLEENEYFKARIDTKQLIHDIKNGIVRGEEYVVTKKTAHNPKIIKKIKPENETPVSDSTTVIEKPASTGNMPIDEVYALIDRMSEIYNVRLAVTEQKLEEFKNKFDEVMKKLEELNVSPVIPVQDSESKKKDELSILTPIILKEDSTYGEWVKAVKRAVGLILKLKPEWTESSVLSSAYERIRAQYGVVWEQEAKEFKNEYGRGPVNTRELCYWMETTKKNYKNLLIGKLNTIYSECRREAAKVG